MQFALQMAEPSLEKLLSEAQSLSSFQQAKVAAIMGALVADAAGKKQASLTKQSLTLSSHWRVDWMGLSP